MKEEKYGVGYPIIDWLSYRYKLNLVDSNRPNPRENERKGNIKLKGKKILKNKKVTILVQKNAYGKDMRYISRNTDSTYDLEKGVMMALLLSEGYTYKDIKQLIDRSKDIPG